MQKLYRRIVNHPRMIITLFLIAAFCSAVCQGMVAVNYDINDYLPPSSASTVALDVLREEYEGGIPNARVLVRNVTLAQALEYKAELAAVDGVTEVTWLDDAASVTVPLETLDADLVETYYQDGNALFSVVIEDGRYVETTDAIRMLIGEENAMSGSAVSTAIATTSTVTQVGMIAIFAVVFVLGILTLTTTTWIEPLIVLGSLGVAILINMGSNLMFGEISFVSNAAGAILQLAVSLDYSVFLIHRYEEFRQEIPDRKEAMVQALCKSTSSILSSGLTTVIGFLALCLMQFQIGPDLGLVLAKGVGISLITVFVFSPVLILSMSNWMDKTRHRPLTPSFTGFGRVIVRTMLPLVLVFLIVIAPAYIASNANDYYYGSSHIFGLDTQLGKDTQSIEDIFGKSDTYVLMVPRGNMARETELSAALDGLDEVTGILSYVDNAGDVIPTEYVEEETRSLLLSDNYSRMVISVDADYEGADTFDLVEKIRQIAQDYYPDQWYLAGEGVSTLDLMQTITADMTKVNLIAIGAVFIVLLFSFKSVSLPVILVLGIETAIWINLSIPYFAGQTIFYISYLIISSIQLGATVDYAILFTDRYLEFRGHMNRKEAIIQTVSAVTVSILTSGLTLTIVGFLLGYISTHGILSQLGMFLGKGTLCSLLIVFFVLPGLLYLFDGVIQRTTRNLNFIEKGTELNEKAQ